MIPAATVAAPLASPLPPLASDDRIKDYVHSFLTNFLSQSGSVGTANNPSFSAPPLVPDSAPPLRGVDGGLGADTLYRGWLTEPSGEVPPTIQEENLSQCVCVFAC